MYGIINKTDAVNVKITMLDDLLSNLAPHYCYGCGKLGSVLCGNCKYNIITDRYELCILCGESASKNGVCGNCLAPFSRAWCVNERVDVLRRLLSAYKFERVKQAHDTLAALLAESTPQLPSDCIVAPIPTISPHVRQRGYDHVELIARAFARKKGLQMMNLLDRRTKTVQMGCSKKERIEQAARAFRVKGQLHGETCLIIDDVVTTGATVASAAEVLLEGGAETVWVAVLARQPLD